MGLRADLSVILKITPKTQLSSDTNDYGAAVGLDETLKEVEPPTLEINTLSQSEVQDVEKVTPERDQLSLEGQDSVEKDKCAPVSGTSPAIQSFMNGIENSHYRK
ncbi:hypothetical protein ROHU_026953 [Labeo rohita]|uniref:Uncharacterized protein n=1 Tax=Labeo rohita TaxID=84645 RepID=A0A498MDK8_LABRO|nr:hypothetical protein ROHU_026953 [Labeo rohita]